MTVRCDYKMGEVPGVRPCAAPVFYECGCERCRYEDVDGRFHSCLNHMDEVDEKHERVYPRHSARWLTYIDEPAVRPVPDLNAEVTAAILEAERALAVAGKAWDRVQSAEQALAQSSIPVAERAIAERGAERARVVVALLETLRGLR